MRSFSLLGIGKNATETEIKRAYARQLKQNRPDGDPVAFQRLQEAYAACLLWARDARHRHDAGGDDQGASAWLADTSLQDSAHSAVLPPVPEPLLDNALKHSEEHPAAGFDFKAFGYELTQRLQTDPPQSLDRWLHAHEALYSLQLKESVRPLVAQLLAAMQNPPTARKLDIVLSFFGLDVLTARGYVADLVHRAMKRSSIGADSFARELRMRSSRSTPVIDRMMLRELQGPPSNLRRLFLLLVPMLPGRVMHLFWQLHKTDPEQALANLDGGAWRFWQQATDRSWLARPRWALAALRLPLYTFGFSLLLNLMIGPPIDLAAFPPLLAWSAGLWLAYATLLVGLARLLPWVKTRLPKDPKTHITALLTLSALATAPFSPLWTTMLLSSTVMVWLSDRREGAFWLSVVVAILGTALWGGLLAKLALAGEHLIALIALLTLATFVIQDVLFARRRKVALAAARGSKAWLGWVFTLQGGALAVLWVVQAIVV